MHSLLLGIIAALAWGVHDLLVRHISQRASIYSSMLTVLFSGLIIMVPVMFVFGELHLVSHEAVQLSIVSGLCFIFGGIGLYKAFSIGPTRLVAPIVGAYPMLSVGWAALTGSPVSIDQWFAVFAVVIGISLTAINPDDSHSDNPSGSRRVAILWAIVGGIGFAMTIAVGQSATRVGADLTGIIVTRFTAMVGLGMLILVLRKPFFPGRKELPVLCVMGLLDGIALAVVLIAGTKPGPEYAAVASSLFGVVTVVLAWMFLKERMIAIQWTGIAIAFSAIAYLTF